MIDPYIRRAAVVAAFALLSCTVAAADPAGTKNDGAPVTWAMPTSDAPDGSVAAGGLGAAYLNCTDSREGVGTASEDYVPIVRCSFFAPVAGSVLVLGSGSLGIPLGGTAGYEAQVRLAVDSTTGDSSTNRYVDIALDAGDGTDRNVAASALRVVSPGWHTFAMIARRFTGTGTVHFYRASLSAVFLPTGATVQACGQAGGPFETTSATFSTVTSCSISVAQAGKAIILANASAGLVMQGASAYEVRYGVGVDSTTPFATADRWLNVYPNAGDGQDETAAIAYVAPVAAGAHTFHFLANRYDGAGTVRLIAPTIAVVVVPDTANALCGAASNMAFDVTSLTAVTLASCPLNLAQPGSVLEIGNASAGMFDNTAASEVEWQFRMANNATDGLEDSQRYVNVYADAGTDGTDRPAFSQGHMAMPAGPVSVRFLGLRASGTGTARAYDPTVAGLLLPASETTIFRDGFE